MRSSNRAPVASSWSVDRQVRSRNERDAVCLRAFLGETTDYVLNEVIDTVLAKDKEFWLGVPRTARRSCRRHRPTSRSESAAPSAVPICSRLYRSRSRTVGRAR